MNELFRLKIATKRQMTAPQRLLDVLSLTEGDEIRIQVTDGKITAVAPCKSVPTELLTDELMELIKRREQEMAEGKGLTPMEALARIKELQGQIVMTP